MSERRTGKEKLHKPPESKLFALHPALLQRIHGFPYNYAIPNYLHISKGYKSPDDWKHAIPKDVTRVPVCMSVPGFGCNAITTGNGDQVSYFSWFFDEYAKLHQSSDQSAFSPPIMYSFDWPGTQMSVQETQRIQKGSDPYSIKHHPQILIHMMDEWIKNMRSVLPAQVRKLDAMMLTHSMGARAAIQAFHELRGVELRRQVELIASRNEFDQINLSAIFEAPAFGLAPQAERLLRILKLPEMADRAMERAAESFSVAGTIFNAYRRISETPFVHAVNMGLTTPLGRFATSLGLEDKYGFLGEFARNNNPHVLVRHGHELMKDGLPIDAFFLHEMLEAGVNILAVTHDGDRLVNNNWTIGVFGKKSDLNDDPWVNPHHVSTGGDSCHVASLHKPRLMAEIVMQHARHS